jgi:hypothetical protein
VPDRAAELASETRISRTIPVLHRQRARGSNRSIIYKCVIRKEKGRPEDGPTPPALAPDQQLLGGKVRTAAQS